MISKKLLKAREYTEKLVGPNQEEEPYFHLTGGVGWINDPNGFSLFNGEYHLFYQHNPYETFWNDIHWGHAKTQDFVTWERLPEALAPDTDADASGCFSGSAIETKDGKHLLMYTGVSKSVDEKGMPIEFQQQCIAIGDGIDYEKYEGNPVITTKDIPEGNHQTHFRDPKIWMEDDTYYAVMGSLAADGSGEILLYESQDAKKWDYVGVVDACNNEYGKMWECPDFFSLDGRQVLIVSPQEMEGLGMAFHAGYNTAVLIGDYDKETKKFVRENINAIDYGTDFYAPQTLLSKDGRRIMTAWMQNWATASCRPGDKKFFGQMILPRELTIENNRLIQKPVREIENYYGNKTTYEDVYVHGEINLQSIHGRVIDLKLHIKPSGEDLYKNFIIKLAMNGDYYTLIKYKPGNNTVKIDRSRSGFPHDIVNERYFHVSNRHGELDLRILLDKYSMEVFVNGGEQVASCVIYTDITASSISFYSEGEVVMDVENNELIFEQEI